MQSGPLSYQTGFNPALIMQAARLHGMQGGRPRSSTSLDAASRATGRRAVATGGHATATVQGLHPNARYPEGFHR